jgi:stage II sporulation protein P
MYPASSYYYRRRLPGNNRKRISTICLVAALMIFTGYGLLKLVNVRDITPDLPAVILGQRGENALNIMCSAMPLLAASQSLDNQSTMQLADVFIGNISRVFRLDRHSPVALLEGELPVLVEVTPEAVPVVKPEPVPSRPPTPVPEEEQQQSREPVLSEECLVAVYNTHTGETYALTDGMERLQGKRGGVVQAAAALQEVLEEKYGIRVARSEAINDEVYKYSYAKSQEVLKKLLEDNPEIVAVFDIHRDAGKSREESIVEIDGEIFAPVLIIVGSDARAEFPGWQNNYRFAKELAAKIDEKYPGLCLGVRVMDGRYNQFLHPRALLLEIGSVSNSTEEAVRTAKLLGEVLGPVILDITEDSGD